MAGKGKTIAVVGGGPVGALNALFLARRGYDVHIYESRSDIRKQERVTGRSINLAVSIRGREALKAIGLEEAALAASIPMYSRMIHSLDGELAAQPYGTKSQAIYSTDRRRLNELLLTEAEKVATLHFEYRLTRADLDKKTLYFDVGKEAKDVAVTADFIFGCDGAYSTVRRQMMRWGRLNYRQEYINHGYKELCMPPTALGDFAMPPNHLHIWARDEFMMIALPNQDKTFTLTLFMPFDIFDSIQTEKDLLAFFTKHFPDSIDLIGVDRLMKDYFTNPTSSLISLRCHPHLMSRSTVILGDAAHAVVPFFGQGLNAGLEDCLIFDELMQVHLGDVVAAATEYADTRWIDTNAIGDLSMDNYLEMRSHVNSRVFVLRKYLDATLHYLFPRFFIPLYTMVAFTRMPYHVVVKRAQRQRRVVNVAGGIGLLAVGGACIYVGYNALKGTRIGIFHFRFGW